MITKAPIPRHQQFSALGHPNRLAVFELLMTQPMAVGELAEHLPISRPAVSQVLALLEQADLVTHASAGTRNIYRVNPAGLEALRGHLEALWAQAMGDFKVAAEAAYQRSKGKKR